MTTTHEHVSLPRTYDPAPTGDVVVGVDGSASSMAALRWAWAQGARTGAPVRAVSVYDVGPAVGFAAGAFPAIQPIDEGAVRAGARSVLDEAVRIALGTDETAVARVVLADGSAARALVRESTGASLLVVGTTHHHRLGAMLGSTVSACLRHARCPVVVVPADAE